MYIAEIIYPGTWLDMDDGDIAFELEGMLHHLGDRVAEAAIALTMFESSREDFFVDPRGEWERDAQFRREIEEQLRSEVGEDVYYRNFDRFYFESQRRALRKKADLGIFPRSYTHKIPFIHAHSFVYAVDSFAKFVDELCDYEVLPSAIREIRDEFNSRLPMVRKIRNSALHLEDRSRRYASTQDKKKGRRMEVSGFLGLSNLEGDKLCYTIDDGSYQRIAVNGETLAVLVESMNKLLQALPWKGQPGVEPS